MIEDRVKQIANALIGKTVKQAEEILYEAKLASRIVSRDGFQYDGDTLMRPNRVNLDVIDDRVVGVRVG